MNYKLSPLERSTPRIGNVSVQPDPNLYSQDAVRAIRSGSDGLTSTAGWRNPVAMTLNLKQVRQSESWAGNDGIKTYRGGTGSVITLASGHAPWVSLIRHDGINYHASNTLKEAMRRINQECYRRDYERGGKQVRIIAALEKGDAIKGKKNKGKKQCYHYQAVMECPEYMTTEDFIAVVKKHWSRMDWGDGCWAEPAHTPPAWNNYILKSETKSSYSESIDWDNLYNPTTG